MVIYSAPGKWPGARKLRQHRGPSAELRRIEVHSLRRLRALAQAATTPICVNIRSIVNEFHYSHSAAEGPVESQKNQNRGKTLGARCERVAGGDSIPVLLGL